MDLRQRNRIAEVVSRLIKIGHNNKPSLQEGPVKTQKQSALGVSMHVMTVPTGLGAYWYRGFVYVYLTLNGGNNQFREIITSTLYPVSYNDCVALLHAQEKEYVAAGLSREWSVYSWMHRCLTFPKGLILVLARNKSRASFISCWCCLAVTCWVSNFKTNPVAWPDFLLFVRHGHHGECIRTPTT